MTHPQIEQIISRYHDLSEAERRQVDHHVKSCDSCAAWLNTCQVMDKVLSDFVMQRQSQVDLAASSVRSPFSVAKSGWKRFPLPQLSTLFGAAARLAGVLLLAAVVAWFALTLRDRGHFAAGVSTAPAGTPLVKSGRELLFIVTPDPEVLVLDPSSLAQVGSLPLNVTEGPAIGLNGDLYFIADFHNLTVLEAATGRQRVITRVTDPLRTQGGIPVPLAVTSDGRRVVVAHYWTPPEAADASATEFWRTVIDVESGALLATIPETREHVRTSDTAACLVSHMLPASDNQTLYELCYWSGSYPVHPGPTVRIIDLQQGAVLDSVRDMALSGSYFGALSPDEQWLYVLTVSGRVVVVRLPDLTVEKVVALGERSGPERIQDYGGRAVFSPDGRLLYLNDRGDPQTLYAIDVATWQTVSQARLAQGESVHNVALSTDGSRLYVLAGSYPHEPMQLSMWDAGTLSRQEVVVMPETVYMPARVLAVNLSPAALERHTKSP